MMGLNLKFIPINILINLEFQCSFRFVLGLNNYSRVLKFHDITKTLKVYILHENNLIFPLSSKVSALPIQSVKLKIHFSCM